MSTHTLTLSEQELEQLNRRHIGGTDKWLRMFMGIASKITRVEDGTIYLQVVYSNKVEKSKARTVARTWLKSPKNSILLQADTIEVTEYTDRGKPGDVIVFGEGQTREEAAQKLDVKETGRFGETKWLIGRHTFDIKTLLEDDKENGNDTGLNV